MYRFLKLIKKSLIIITKESIFLTNYTKNKIEYEKIKYKKYNKIKVKPFQDNNKKNILNFMKRNSMLKN